MTKVVLFDAPPAVLRVEVTRIGADQVVESVRLKVFEGDGAREAHLTGPDAERLAEALCPPDAGSA